MTRKKAKRTVDMRCQDCGSKLVRETRPTEYTYKGHSITVEQPAWWCTDCGEAILVGRDVSASEPAFIELKARVEGLLPPSEIRRIRTKLKLSQRKAGAVLGGGPNAFQKYEKGEVGVSQAMSNLLRLLDQDPGLLKKIGKQVAA
jgi:HTH-type transcriptional regulator / antitoxin MqsA